MQRGLFCANKKNCISRSYSKEKFLQWNNLVLDVKAPRCWWSCTLWWEQCLK
jgi:hypothetical protein